MGALEDGAGASPGNFVFYGVAGGILVSRAVAELSFTGDEQRFGGLGLCVSAFWIFSHHERRISELAIRIAGIDCGIFLWVDMAEDEFDFCVSDSSRSGGRDVALYVSDGLEGGSIIAALYG